MSYTPPSQRKSRAPMIFGVIVGLLVAAAACVYLYGVASDRMDRDRLPELKKERSRLFIKIFPGENGLGGTPEEQRRYDEVQAEIARIQAKHPDLK